MYSRRPREVFLMHHLRRSGGSQWRRPHDRAGRRLVTDSKLLLGYGSSMAVACDKPELPERMWTLSRRGVASPSSLPCCVPAVGGARAWWSFSVVCRWCLLQGNAWDAWAGLICYPNGDYPCGQDCCFSTAHSSVWTRNYRAIRER